MAGVTTENLYPYLVPRTYFGQSSAPHPLATLLGHDIWIALVFDLGGLVQSVSTTDLEQLRLGLDAARALALGNLDRLASTQELKMAVMPNGPQSRPFVLVGGHWAAATAILLPNLASVATRPLGSSDILASIPHREALLLFAERDRAYRDEMRRLVREKESDGRKPLTFELFRLGAGGVTPFSEPVERG